MIRTKLHILLVNGNSSQSVTDRLVGLAAAAAPQLEFRPLTPKGGPPYVSTPADYAMATDKVVETITLAAREDEPDGCIIACFGEPGLLEARRRFHFPIVGMAEASMLTAMQLGGKFAMVTLGEHWPAMLHDLVKVYGVQDRCIGIEIIEGTPFELMANPQHAAESVIATATNCGAQTVIIGGAALTGLASAIGPLPGIQLIDCLQASIAQVVALTAYRRMAAIQTPKR
jgi:Asp/Glu/hydantoin racemase